MRRFRPLFSLYARTVSKKFDVSKFAQASLYVVVMASLLGCEPVATLSRDVTLSAFSTPAVQVTVLPPMPMTPTAECKSASGIELEAVAVSAHTVHVKIMGLKPNERVTFVFDAEVAGQTFRIESRPVEGAGEDGRLEYTQGGLVDQTSNIPFKDWQIQVIHARGVACAAVHLP